MQSKYCPKCASDLPIMAFCPNKHKAGGRETYCRDCMRQYKAAHYIKNKSTYRVTRAKTRQRRRDTINAYKAERGCCVCGLAVPKILHFHHTDPNVKDDSVSRLLKNESMATVWREIDKCVIYCANCHGVYHMLVHDGVLTEKSTSTKIKNAITKVMSKK